MKTWAKEHRDWTREVCERIEKLEAEVLDLRRQMAVVMEHRSMSLPIGLTYVPYTGEYPNTLPFTVTCEAKEKKC